MTDNSQLNPEDETLFQSFRIASESLSLRQSSSTSPVLEFPVRTDKKTGHCFVLWRELQTAFEGASYVTNNGRFISFVEDENYEE